MSDLDDKLNNALGDAAGEVQRKLREYQEDLELVQKMKIAQAKKAARLSGRPYVAPPPIANFLQGAATVSGASQRARDTVNAMHAAALKSSPMPTTRPRITISQPIKPVAPYTFVYQQALDNKSRSPSYWLEHKNSELPLHRMSIADTRIEMNKLAARHPRHHILQINTGVKDNAGRESPLLLYKKGKISPGEALNAVDAFRRETHIPVRHMGIYSSEYRHVSNKEIGIGIGVVAGTAALGYGGYKAYQHRDDIRKSFHTTIEKLHHHG